MTRECPHKTEVELKKVQQGNGKRSSSFEQVLAMLTCWRHIGPQYVLWQMKGKSMSELVVEIQQSEERSAN